MQLLNSLSSPFLSLTGLLYYILTIIVSHRAALLIHFRSWTTAPNMATWNGLGYHIVEKKIDTTIAMFRRGQDFDRNVGMSFRAYAPYGESTPIRNTRSSSC